MDTLLRVSELFVSYRHNDEGERMAIRGASLNLAAGEVIGLLGESGCGKTTLALSILRLLAAAARVAGGCIQFRERDLLKLSEKDMEGVRGAEVSLIFQEPGIALHPMLRAGDQVADVIRVHRGWPRARCREEARAALGRAGLADTDRIYSAYPHQLSGGQRQRILIAMALACEPALIIADEPTASLDATVQAEILDLFKSLRSRLQLSMLWISHQPAVLAQIAERVLVMYAGQIVEEGPLREVFRNPLHPYTRALVAAHPTAPAEAVASPRRPLRVMAGEPRDPGRTFSGCAFEMSCPDRMEICRTREPGETQPESARRVRCFKYGG